MRASRRYTIALHTLHLVQALRGNLPFEELKSRVTLRPDDILSTSNLDKAEGYWHLFHDRFDDAAVAFERCQVPIQHWLLNFHSVAGYAAVARALRMQAEAANDSRAGVTLLDKAYRQARRGVRWGRLFPSGNAEALREMSLTLQKLGKTKRALKYATKSCRVAQHQDAKYEYAQSDLVRARLMHGLEMPDADKHIEAAEAELERFDKEISSTIDSA